MVRASEREGSDERIEAEGCRKPKQCGTAELPVTSARAMETKERGVNVDRHEMVDHMSAVSTLKLSTATWNAHK